MSSGERTELEAKRPLMGQLPGWLTWGAMIGFAQIFAMLTVGPLGVSTAYPQFAGFLLDKLFPGFAQEQPYLREIGAQIGWEVMLVLGILLGAALSYGLSHGPDRAKLSVAVPPVAVKGFTGRRLHSYARAFLGGFLFIFGARLAGGCTTGHMLSGMAQMALSGLVFAAAAFGSGMLIAQIFFREPQKGEAS